MSIHLDHVENPELLDQAAAAGFSSLMYDASMQPYDDNVAATRRAGDRAHDHGLWLEAELGEVGAKSGAHAPEARTDPADAAAYVAETGVDSLADAIGSSHAMTTQTATLDLELLQRLHDEVPVPLVLHGSSGVPHSLPRAAVMHGIVKVNTGTALNVAYTDAVRGVLTGAGASTDPRNYLRSARPDRESVAQLLGVLQVR